MLHLVRRKYAPKTLPLSSVRLQKRCPERCLTHTYEAKISTRPSRRQLYKCQIFKVFVRSLEAFLRGRYSYENQPLRKLPQRQRGASVLVRGNVQPPLTINPHPLVFEWSLVLHFHLLDLIVHDQPDITNVVRAVDGINDRAGPTATAQHEPGIVFGGGKLPVVRRGISPGFIEVAREQGVRPGLRTLFHRLLGSRLQFRAQICACHGQRQPEAQYDFCCTFQKLGVHIIEPLSVFLFGMSIRFLIRQERGRLGHID